MQVKAIIKKTMLITHVLLVIIFSSCEVGNVCCYTFQVRIHYIFLSFLFIRIFGFFRHPIHLFKSNWSLLIRRRGLIRGSLKIFLVVGHISFEIFYL